MKKKKYVFWIIIVFFFGILFAREQYLMYNLKNVKRDYTIQLSKLKIQNEQLNNQKLITKRNDYIETEAREKLGLVKPGEVLFIDRDKKGD
jgi:cell division protein FtsB